MRTLFAILASITLLSAKAQTHAPMPPTHLLIPTWAPGYLQGQFMPPYPLMTDNADPKKKWFLRSYASMSAGYIFFNGGISYLSAPIGLILYHPLNNNLTAFGRASLIPTAFSVNRLLTAPGYPGNGFSSSGLGLSTRLEGGLMYTNDAKTFSISSSISVERGSYPAYQAPATHPATYRAN